MSWSPFKLSHGNRACAVVHISHECADKTSGCVAMHTGKYRRIVLACEKGEQWSHQDTEKQDS